MVPRYEKVSISLRGLNGSTFGLRWRMLNALEESGVDGGSLNQIHQAALNCDTYDELASFVSQTVTIDE